jgi:hypothetical protein
MINCTEQEARHFLGETRKCRKSPGYFLDTFCQIFDAAMGAWVPFQLWPAQRQALGTIQDHRLTVVLKARQLGMTWLVLGVALWEMLFHPAATVLLFSRRDEEAVDLLKVRLRGMYDRLPPWLQVDGFRCDNDHEWHWSNGSRVLAFPTTGGDSYSARLVIVDEADLVPNLGKLLASVKPTMDAGGKLLLVSRADTTRPQSPFKRIYRAARAGRSHWRALFLPWSARPDRDATWYETQKADILHRTGALDELYEHYPATDAEALLPRSLNKRIAAAWLVQCLAEQPPLAELPPGAPAVPGLEVYALPRPGRCYVVGADPAEGNPTSDDSALAVIDRDSGEEVAALAGKLQPATLAAHINGLGMWYHGADVIVERNNHGHAVLLWLREHSGLVRLAGHDGNEGWLSSSRGKALLYDLTANALRERRALLHSAATCTQLARIEGSTLRAPEGEADDRADAFALACAASLMPQYKPYTGPVVYWPPVPFGSEPADRDNLARTTADLLREFNIDPEDEWERRWWK